MCIRDSPYPVSLGLFYSSITDYLGFGINEGEYKVMGLASYGDSNSKSAKLVRGLMDWDSSSNEMISDMSYFDYHLSLVGRRTEEGVEISSIMSDELRHHGMAKKHFLNHYPALQPWQLIIYRIRETINNRGRKIYDANLKFLDRLLTPLYKTMAYLAGTIAKKLNLNEFKRKDKNLMNISSNSIL